MRALVLGGAGFIGSRLPHALARLGHETVTAARSSGDLRIDRRDPAGVARAIRAERCDVVIDMIAYDAPTTDALYEAVRGLVSRFVLVSSADVYRAYGALHRLEECAVATVALTEDSARRSRLYPYRRTPQRARDAADAWMDDYDKIPLEEALAGPQTTIVRLPMVYGPGDRQRRFGWIVAPMQGGAAEIAAPAAWLDWMTTYGHVDDVAHALALCATHEVAAGRAYNCGEQPVSHRNWVSRFAAAHGWKGAVRADESAPISAMLASLDLRHTLALSTERIRTELGFSEVVPPNEAVMSAR